MLLALAKYAPSVAGYVFNLYVRTLPKLIFDTEDWGVRVSTHVQGSNRDET